MLPSPPFVPEAARHAGSLILAAFDNGLFANVLQVLDAALLARSTGAALHVQWRRTPGQREFTYGSPGVDVWQRLFEPVHDSDEQRSSTGRSAQSYRVTNQLNPLLLAPSRNLYFTAPFLARHRVAYASVFADTIRPLPALLRRVDELDADARLVAARAAGGRVVGVHCRMVSPSAARAQAPGTMSPCSGKKVLAHLRAALEASAHNVLYVASDSSADATALTDAFGERCVLRKEVHRAPSVTIEEIIAASRDSG